MRDPPTAGPVDARSTSAGGRPAPPPRVLDAQLRSDPFRETEPELARKASGKGTRKDPPRAPGSKGHGHFDVALSSHEVQNADLHWTGSRLRAYRSEQSPDRAVEASSGLGKPYGLARVQRDQEPSRLEIRGGLTDGPLDRLPAGVLARRKTGREASVRRRTAGGRRRPEEIVHVGEGRRGPARRSVRGSARLNYA